MRNTPSRRAEDHLLMRVGISHENFPQWKTHVLLATFVIWRLLQQLWVCLTTDKTYRCCPRTTRWVRLIITAACILGQKASEGLWLGRKAKEKSLSLSLSLSPSSWFSSDELAHYNQQCKYSAYDCSVKLNFAHTVDMRRIPQGTNTVKATLTKIGMRF